MNKTSEHNLAIYIDFENLAIGLRGKKSRFEIRLVLNRLLEKGKIIVKRAYCDWESYPEYKEDLHGAGIELIEIPKRKMTGKNSADIRLVVDAMDLCYSKPHIDTFVIVSGDSDFSPLVSKLKENGKNIIGLGMEESTSELLRDNCDEFIYYEDLAPSERAKPAVEMIESVPTQKRKVFNLLAESVAALIRENKDPIYPSMVKDTMKRKKPSFNEQYHGYGAFTELLEDAAKNNIIELTDDTTGAGFYLVRGFPVQKTRKSTRSPRKKSGK